MNSLKKGEGVPLLNFVGGLGVPLLNFEGGPGVPLLNFRGVPGPTFKLWGGSRGPGPTFTPCLSVSSSWCFYCKFWTYFTSFCSLSIEQVKVSRVVHQHLSIFMAKLWCQDVTVFNRLHRTCTDGILLKVSKERS